MSEVDTTPASTEAGDAAKPAPGRARAWADRVATAAGPLRRVAATGPGRLGLIGLLGVAGAIGIVVGLNALQEPASSPGEVPSRLVQALIATGVLLATGLVAAVLTRSRARSLHRAAVRATWLTGAFGVGLGVPVAILATVARLHDTAGLDTVRRLGNAVDAAATVTSPLGLPPLALAILVSLAAVAAFVLLVPPILARLSRAGARAVTPVTTVLVLVASLMLFGGRIEASAAHLQSQVDQDTEGLQAATDVVAQHLAAKVAQRLHDRLVDALPARYWEALPVTGLYGTFEERVRNLRDDIGRADEYDVTDEAAEQVLEAESAKLSDIVNHYLGQVEPQGATTVPGEATHPQIAALTEASGALSAPERLVLAQVGIQAYTILITGIDPDEITRLLGAAARAVPVTEPLLSAYADLFTADLGEQVRDGARRVVAQALSTGRPLSQLIVQEAVVIAGSIDVDAAASQARPRAEALLDAYTASIDAVQAASVRVNRKLADVLIGRLSSADEDTVSDASFAFGPLGSSLTKAQVDRVVAIMRGGSRTWRHDVRPAPESAPHCIRRTTTSVRYYAATIIDAIASASEHVSDTLASEARRVKGQARTVELTADPGWICFEIPRPPIPNF